MKIEISTINRLQMAVQSYGICTCATFRIMSSSAGLLSGPGTGFSQPVFASARSPPGMCAIFGHDRLGVGQRWRTSSSGIEPILEKVFFMQSGQGYRHYETDFGEWPEIKKVPRLGRGRPDVFTTE